MYTPADQFNVTQWTKVLRAGQGDPEGRSALSELCAAYWRPVCRFLRSEGRPEDVANELTQAFFTKLLQQGNIGAVDRTKGKFRTYLLGAVKHFLRDERAKERSQKRGGGQSIEMLPEETTEAGGARLAHSAEPVSDAYFDKEWALQVLERALNSLASEMKLAGREATFEQLKPWLTGEAGRISQAAIAAELNQSEGAIKVAIHRLRQRFREFVRGEIAATLEVGADVDQEVRYLVEVLSA